MRLYVNTVTGTIDEVDGDSFLIDTDNLPGDDWEDLDAEDLLAFALNSDAQVEEIAR